MTGAAVAIDGLDVDLGGRRVLRDVSLSVEAGALLALVGPSGSGKSTLLRAVAGLVPAGAGRVRLGGRDVTALPPEARRVGLVFQDHALFPHRTVAGNVGFGVPRAEREGRVRAMLALVRLEAHADRYPHELSGGEQQRVALARALAPAPDVLLLDEPFASLDADLRAGVRDEVADLLRAAGTTAVLVTHDRDDALSVADRVAVLRAGRVEQAGAPAELHDRPARAFVARFLGGADVVDPAEIGLPPDPGRRAVVRPAQLRLAPGGAATVERCGFRDGRWRHAVRLPSGTAISVDDDRPWPCGARVSVAHAGAREVWTVPAEGDDGEPLA